MERKHESRPHRLQAEVLSGLDASQVETLSRDCSWTRHPAGSLIVGYRDASDSVLFLQEGHCRATLFSPTGRQLIFRDFRVGDLVAEIAAIDGRGRAAEVIAVSDCLIAAMPAAAYRRLLEASPHAMWWEMRRLADMVRELTNSHLELATMPLRYRLSAFLLRVAAQQRVDSEDCWIGVPMDRHEELASRLGSHREAVTKTLRQIQGSGGLRKVGRSVELNPLRLRQLLEEVH